MREWPTFLPNLLHAVAVCQWRKCEQFSFICTSQRIIWNISFLMFNFQIKKEKMSAHCRASFPSVHWTWLTGWLRVLFTAAAVAACIISAESVPTSSHVVFYICQYHNIIWWRNGANSEGNGLFEPEPRGELMCVEYLGENKQPKYEINPAKWPGSKFQCYYGYSWGTDTRPVSQCGYNVP